MNHVMAKLIVDALPVVQNAPNPAKLSLLTRVIGWLESNYGAGWTGAGKGSNNWGAITGKYKGASFQHEDSRPESRPNGSTVQVKYTTDFRAYPNDEEAAADLASLLQRKYASAVAAAPSWPDVARELYGYYLGVGTREQAIAAWARRGAQVAGTIQAATLEPFPDLQPATASPPPVATAPAAGGGTSFPVVALGILVSAVVTFLATVYGPRKRR